MSKYPDGITEEDIQAVTEIMDARRWLPSPLPFLYAWRMRQGLSQRQLADAAGLSEHHIGNLERPETEQRAAVVASDLTIRKLMAALDVPDARWFWEADELTAELVQEAYVLEQKGKSAPVEDLKARRKAAGLSQVELAGQAGVHVNTVRIADRGGRVSGDSGVRINRAVYRCERM